MTRNIQHRSVRNSRSERGSTIVGGVTGFMLFIGVAAPISFFLINCTIQLVLQQQLSYIANQAAIGVQDPSRYWLGLARPGFDLLGEKQKIEERTKLLCKQVGLKPTKLEVMIEPPNNGQEISVTQVDLTVEITDRSPFRVQVFGFDFSRIFASSLSARGVAVASSNVQPYALMHFEAPATLDGDQRGKFNPAKSSDPIVGLNVRETAFIPIYGFGLKNAAGQPDSAITRYDGGPNGGGINQDLDPENFVAFNHYNLIQEDVDALANGSLDQVKSSGWHIQRKFGNQASNAVEKEKVGLTP